MVDNSDRAREEFFSEAQEIVESLGRDLLRLDEGLRRGKPDAELVNDIFRSVHTLKGLSGLFGATRMSSLSHTLESLLDDLRLGRVQIDADILDILFRAVEVYGRILQQEKDAKEQPVPELERLLNELAGVSGNAPQGGMPAEYDLDPSLLAVLTEYEEHRLKTNIEEGLDLYKLRVQFQLISIDESLDQLKVLAKPHGEIITYLPTGAGADADTIELDILMASLSPEADLRTALEPTGAVIDAVPRKARKHETSTPSSTPATGASVDSDGVGSINAPLASLLPPPEKSSILPPAEEGGSLRSVTQTVRVDIHRLDSLMNVVGELSIVKTAFERLIDRVRDTSADRELITDLARVHRSFERHLESMQQGILEVRMVPLGQVFDKLARVARQISREARKEVHLVITGAETEVDKLIVEELSDPLMHMMRNAIDHGIEERSVRNAVGKPDVGTIALNAFQKGNHVVIEIEDDGGGVDADRLLSAALARGVVRPDEARSLSRREVLGLIFVAGLSTKTDVSEVSGRGVGMDVVKTNIAKLGGVIDVSSEVGIGTKFNVTLPITLAIISALVVRVGAEVFAIPLSNIQEAVLLDEQHIRKVDGRDVLTLRGSSLRLCDLRDLFKLPPRPDGEGARRYVVVTAVGPSRLGLVVDRLVGGQDVVIKPLGPSLQSVRGFAGAAELGDQSLGLVLDAPGLIEELQEGERGRPAERTHG